MIVKLPEDKAVIIVLFLIIDCFYLANRFQMEWRILQKEKGTPSDPHSISNSQLGLLNHSQTGHRTQFLTQGD